MDKHKGGTSKVMPRVSKLVKPKEFRGYAVNDKYTYDKDQLNTIVEALEYYCELNQTDPLSNYQVFDITINVEDDTSLSADMDDIFFDASDLRFNPSTIKDNVLTPDKYFFRLIFPLLGTSSNLIRVYTSASSLEVSFLSGFSSLTFSSKTIS